MYPIDRRRIPAVSPLEIFLCCLVNAYVHPPSQDTETGDQLDPRQVAHRLATFLLQELKCATSPTYPSLRSLLIRLQEVLGPAGKEVARSVLDVFQKLESPDDVIGLFDDLQELFEADSNYDYGDGKVVMALEPDSVLGIFVRRCGVAFRELPFEGVARLWRDLQTLLQDAVTGVEEHEPCYRDAGALEGFLSDRLQKTEEKGCSAPMSALEDELQELESARDLMPRLLYVKLVNSLDHKDYLAALDQLHQYFDYMGAPGGPGMNSNQSPPFDPYGASYQSALLGLSSANASLGHVPEAMQAINEAFRVATQGNDPRGLLNALAALCRTLQMQNGGQGLLTGQGGAVGGKSNGEQQIHLLRLLRRCLERSWELGCPHVAAYARLALAKFHLQHQVDPLDGQLGGGAPEEGASGGISWGSIESGAGGPKECAALQVGDALRDVSRLQHASLLGAMASNLSNSFGGSSAGRLAQQRAAAGVGELYVNSDVFGSNIKCSESGSSRVVHQLTGGAHLLRAASWYQYGNPSLAHAHILMFLTAYGRQARADDVAVAYGQLLELTADCQGFSCAHMLVNHIVPKLPLSAQRPLWSAYLGLNHSLAVNRGDMRTAFNLVEEMQGLPDPTGALDIDLRLECQRRRAMTLMESGALQPAYTATGTLFSDALHGGLYVEAIGALLVYARIMISALNPLGALPFLLSALLHCQMYGMDMQAAEASLLLAKVWKEMVPGSRGPALKLLEDVLPLILAHGPLALQGEVLLTLAEVILEDQQELEEAVGERSSRLLEEAADAFQYVELWARAAHCYLLLASVHDARGAIGSRDAAAAAHLRCLEMSQKKPWQAEDAGG